MAIIKAANEVRFKPTPQINMINKVPPTEKSNELPTNIPARDPITIKMITITINRDSIKFKIKPLFASCAILFSG